MKTGKCKEKLYVTIVGLDKYFGGDGVKKDAILKAVREDFNEHDSDAILLAFPVVGKAGYIANNPYTVKSNTLSATEVRRRLGDKNFYVRVIYRSENRAIGQIIVDKSHAEMVWKKSFLAPGKRLRKIRKKVKKSSCHKDHAKKHGCGCHKDHEMDPLDERVDLDEAELLSEAVEGIDLEESERVDL